MRKTLIFLTLFFLSLQANALIEIDENSEFIGAVLETEGRIEIWINTRQYWNENHALISSYSESQASQVEQIADWANLCNLAESQYEPCKKGRTIKDIKRILMRLGVMIEEDFQIWAEKEIRS